MLADTKIAQSNQLKIEQKIRHQFFFQRNRGADAPLVYEQNHQYHVDRVRALGNHDTASRYTLDVALYSIKNMFGGHDENTQE